jgi:peptide-methionine (S)-S-oxide reductase
VEIEFDPERIPYSRLLEVFRENHDPATLNRQGPDAGTRYRSAIFYHDEGQKRAAEAWKAAREASGRYRRPIVTQIAPAAPFWRAEEYHQRYLEKRGLPNCHL